VTGDPVNNESIYMKRGKGSGDLKQKARVLGPLECALAENLGQRSTCHVDAAESRKSGTEDKLQKSLGIESKFVITGEPLYGGQGNNNKLNNIWSNTCLSFGSTNHRETNVSDKGLSKCQGELAADIWLMAQETEGATGSQGPTASPTWEGLKPPQLEKSRAAN
jgi:hypothetical protein